MDAAPTGTLDRQTCGIGEHPTLLGVLGISLIVALGVAILAASILLTRRPRCPIRPPCPSTPGWGQGSAAHPSRRFRTPVAKHGHRCDNRHVPVEGHRYGERVWFYDAGATFAGWESQLTRQIPPLSFRCGRATSARAPFGCPPTMRHGSSRLGLWNDRGHAG
jgi:hypothetical protein